MTQFDRIHEINSALKRANVDRTLCSFKQTSMFFCEESGNFLRAFWSVAKERKSYSEFDSNCPGSFPIVPVVLPVVLGAVLVVL